MAAYERRRAALTQGEGMPDLYALTTLAFGLRYERAVLAWFGGLTIT